jgi:hypothetical protein
VRCSPLHFFSPGVRSLRAPHAFMPAHYRENPPPCQPEPGIKPQATDKLYRYLLKQVDFQDH